MLSITQIFIWIHFDLLYVKFTHHAKTYMLTLLETTPISWSPIWVTKSQVMSFSVHNLFQIYPIFSQNLNFLRCIVQFDSECRKGGFYVNSERLFLIAVNHEQKNFFFIIDEQK